MIIKGQKRVWLDVPFSFEGSEFIVDSLVESEHGEQITLWHLEGEEPGSRSALTDFMVERSRLAEALENEAVEDALSDLSVLNEVVQDRRYWLPDDVAAKDEFPKEFIADLSKFLDKWYGTIVDGAVW